MSLNILFDNVDGLSPILRRLEPTFIFCDADVLLPVEAICTTIGLNVKLLTVNESVEGFDSLDSLTKGTATEDDAFVYVSILATIKFLLFVNYYFFFANFTFFFQLYRN